MFRPLRSSHSDKLNCNELNVECSRPRLQRTLQQINGNLECQECSPLLGIPMSQEYLLFHGNCVKMSQDKKGKTNDVPEAGYLCVIHAALSATGRGTG